MSAWRWFDEDSLGRNAEQTRGHSEVATSDDQPMSWAVNHPNLAPMDAFDGGSVTFLLSGSGREGDRR